MTRGTKEKGDFVSVKTIMALLVAALASAAHAVSAADPADGTPATGALAVPSFRRDVMPIFFRAGCNAGTCHGSARGKDGFMLSLFGYDPAGDYFRTVEEIPGRRVNTSVPAASLLVLKATGAVSHTGGKLFERDSELAKTLLAWIAAGAPNDVGSVPEVTSISLPKRSVVFKSIGQQGSARVTASYSDGTTRDVTDLALFASNNASVADIDKKGRVTAKGPGDTTVFARFNRFTIGAEVIVLPSAEGFVWPTPPENNFIDRLVFERLEKLRIVPAELCDDETFLRRITLDLAARPPTVEEYAAFMADNAADKRSRKIDVLLASDDFTDYLTGIWAELFRVKSIDYTGRGDSHKPANAFVAWLREQVAADRPEAATDHPRHLQFQGLSTLGQADALGRQRHAAVLALPASSAPRRRVARRRRGRDRHAPFPASLGERHQGRRLLQPSTRLDDGRPRARHLRTVGPRFGLRLRHEDRPLALPGDALPGWRHGWSPGAHRCHQRRTQEDHR